MPIDPSVILAGKPLDTATPINDLAATQRQNTLDTMALKSANLDQMSKQNIYATQLLSAAAGSGDQNLWTTTKQHLQQNGIDTSNVPDDIASGKSWADAARLAQSPYGSLLNAAGKMDANAAAAATVNGTKVAPNAFTTALLGGGTLGGGAGGGTAAAPAKPVAITRDPASASAPEQPSADIQQTQKTIQAHYDGMTPRDQSRIQSVTAGAAGLMPFLQNNDSQGALNYLQQRKAQLTSRMGSGEGIDTQDTDAAIQMLKDGKIDELKQSVAGIMAYGQTVGHLPQDQARDQDYLTQLTNAKAPQGFVPPPQQANENPATYDKRVAMAKQTYDSRPDVIASKKEVETAAGKTGEHIGEAGKTLDIMQSNLPTVLERFQNMRNAASNASYGYGVTEEGTGAKQEFHNQFNTETGDANQQLKQYAAQGILPELGPQLAQAGIRGNKFLESLASSASGLDLTASPSAKAKLIDGLENTYIKNLKATAAQLRAHGQQVPADAEIDAAVAQFKSGNKGGNAQPAQGGNQPPPGAVFKGTSSGKRVYQLPDGSTIMEQ